MIESSRATGLGDTVVTSPAIKRLVYMRSSLAPSGGQRLLPGFRLVVFAAGAADASRSSGAGRAPPQGGAGGLVALKRSLGCCSRFALSLGRSAPRCFAAAIAASRRWERWSNL